MSVEPIPLEVLVAARLRMKRRIAAMIIRALAESGMTYAEVDVRIGARLGFAKRYINNLIEGREKGLDFLSDLAVGLGFELEISASQIAPAAGSILDATLSAVSAGVDLIGAEK